MYFLEPYPGRPCFWQWPVVVRTQFGCMQALIGGWTYGSPDLLSYGHYRAHHAGAPIYSGMFHHWDVFFAVWGKGPSLYRLKAVRNISAD